MARPPARTKPPAPPRLTPTPADEAVLVAACLRGDTAAWRRLISRYERVIYSIPRRFGLGEADAAEVFQNVCLALYRGLPRLRLAAGLTRWVLVTTRRQARDLAIRRRREVPDLDDGISRRRADPGPAPDEIIAEMEARLRVRAALARLNERCARLLEWLYLEPDPPSYKEVARRLGVPEGTVGPTRARCLAKLRAELEKITGRRTK